MNRWNISRITAVLVLFFISVFLPITQNSSQADPGVGDHTGLGNPAAVYCHELGYDYYVEHGSDGERGICTFPDQRECEAWSFLQGECGKAYSYCEKMGLATKAVPAGQGVVGKPAICVDEDKKEIGSVGELFDLTQKSAGCGGSAEMTQATTETSSGETSSSETSPPPAFDWRSVDGGNWMSPVKNQLQCGSCWAFAAVGVAESAINISLGDPTYDVDLSEEYLVTDAQPYSDCCGGSKASSLFLIRDEGVPVEDCLAYVEGDSDGCSCDGGTCDSNCTYNSSSECADRRQSDTCGSGDMNYEWHDLETVGTVDGSDRANIKSHLVTYGPLAVSMEWEGFGGFDGDNIYRCATDDSTNHAVVITGYDDAEGYWVVRNSWGSGFGDNGYFKVGYGECRIEDYVYYVSNNQPPHMPSDPDPGQGGTDVGLDSDLIWTGGDPNPGDTVTYDVYLDPGTDDPASLVCGGVSQESCDPGTLQDGTTYTWKVVARDNRGGETSSDLWQFTTRSQTEPNLVDFDADGATEISVFRPSNGNWYVKDGVTVWWGLSGDIPVPANYDGDLDTDIAVYRPSNGKWYVYGESPVWWGLSGDIPVPGDYDGDGAAEKAVFRPSNGNWYVYGGSGVWWGLSGDVPVPGDYDGDGSMDIAVYRPSNGKWYIKGNSPVWWGMEGDIPVPGDYDGDGATDIAVYRPSNGKWYVKGGVTVWWGLSGDIPVPGDYDGDGKTDIAVLRPSNGKWYIKDQISVWYYLQDDYPLPVRDTNADGDAHH